MLHLNQENQDNKKSLFLQLTVDSNRISNLTQ